MIFNLTHLQEQLNIATGNENELSTILVEDPSYGYALAGVTSWFSLDFQAEHDCQLFFVELDNGEHFSCIGYSSKAIYDAIRKEHYWANKTGEENLGVKLEWEHFLTAEGVQNMYEDNLHQNGSRYKLIANVLAKNLNLI